MAHRSASSDQPVAPAHCDETVALSRGGRQLLVSSRTTVTLGAMRSKLKLLGFAMCVLSLACGGGDTGGGDAGPRKGSAGDASSDRDSAADGSGSPSDGPQHAGGGGDDSGNSGGDAGGSTGGN